MVFSGLLAVGVNALAVATAHAEFPPEGAVADANNPSLATGDIADPSRKGTLRHYIFYFDCGKRDWIGVPVAGTATNSATSPRAVGPGREFPPGPPLGSKTVSGTPGRAVTASGQAFVQEDGSWFDAKTRTPMPSPSLCPESRRPSKPATGSAQDHHSAGGDALPSAKSAQPNEQKPDQLPPPPQFKP